MFRLLFALALAVTVSGPTIRPTSLKADLAFLARDGCFDAPQMTANLNGALKALGLPSDYQHVNIDTLSKTDARVGYPSPTVLYKGKDLIGMPTPKPPYPETT